MPFLFFTLVLVISGCNNNKNNFGPLGSTHVHADFKVYILGNPIDFSLSKYQLKDQLTHVENDDGMSFICMLPELIWAIFLKL